MLRFIISRLFWMMPSLIVVSFLSFVLIQLPPGDYVTTYIATLAASNEVVDQNTAADLRERFGLDQPMIVQYWKWIIGHPAPRRFRAELRMAAAGGRPDLGAHGADPGAHLLDAARHLGHRAADRRVLGREEVLDRRLHRDLPLLPRPRHPELPAGAGADVHRRRRVRAGGRRAVLRAVRHRALEHGQGRRPAAPSLDPRDHPGRVGHGEPDPRDARQHARRAQQALCHDGARQGPLRVPRCW